MTLGAKIKKLRTEKGLTQKDLADQIFVTFQTVSKWEKDENEPDVATLRELAKLFDCSMDYLLSEDDGNKEEVVNEEPMVTKTIIIHQKELHVCRRCNKDIPENELHVEPMYTTSRHGRSSSTSYVGDGYYHKACFEAQQKEIKEQKERIRAQKAKRAKKLSFGWGIAGAIAGLAISLPIFLGATTLNPGISVLLSILIAYGLFAGLYCFVSGSYIADIVSWALGLTIRFPGLIFTWDLEGFKWLILMKLLFVALSFLFGLATVGLAIALGAAFGSFSFPFVLIHNIHTNYDDAITD